MLSAQVRTYAKACLFNRTLFFCLVETVGLAIVMYQGTYGQTSKTWQS